MKNTVSSQSQGLWLSVVPVAAAYLWGVLSIQHYLPAGSLGLYVNQHVAALLALGLLAGFVFFKPQTVSVGTVAWLALLLLVLLQPLLHTLPYTDALIFPVATLMLCLLLAWLVGSWDDGAKARAVHMMACALLAGGVLMVFTQIAQMFEPHVLSGRLVFLRHETTRFIGNIGQVNQAAFVIAMGMAAAVYFVHRTRKRTHWALSGIALMVLAAGIGLSASRGGILLAGAAVVGGGLFYPVSGKKRMAVIVSVGLLILTGYVVGTELLAWSSGGHQASAVGRMVNENSLHLRQHLLQEAWMAFAEHPLTGVGWRNISAYGLENAEKIKWFTVAHHTHNLVAQFAAELGLLGLAVLALFAWVMIANFGFKLPPFKAFSYSVLMLVGMYSLSEYPLWFLRFALLAAFFTAVVEQRPVVVLRLNLNPAAFVLSAVILLGSIYYIFMYRPYIHAAYMLRSDIPTFEEKVETYHALPNVFGYSQYKDMMFFALQPLTTEQLSQRIELGNRVLSVYLAQDMLIKQADFYTLANDTGRADKLYQAACLFEYAAYCGEVVGRLKTLAEQDPEKYQDYYTRFGQWYQTRFGKVLSD